jgi:hypothetical protein
MATYKVIQDIEAEDKFLGPLTLKQFIFAAITVLSLYLSFFFLTKHLWYLTLPLLPIIIFCGFLAVPWGRDQPTEIWLLAKLRFFFKPRRRIWDQTGIQELVKITAPKKVEENLTDGLDQSEVKSRLRALADTIDSRGWAVKNVNVNLFAQPGYSVDDPTSDRLIGLSSLPQVSTTMKEDTSITDSDDIFDSPAASHVDAQLAEAAQQHQSTIQQTIDQVRNPDTTAKPDYWFVNQPSPPEAKQQPKGYTTFAADPTVHPGTKTEDLPAALRRPAEPIGDFEKSLLAKVHQRRHHDQAFAHRRKVLTPEEIAEQQKAPPSLTNTPDPAILNLARDNNRNISSLAREAGEHTSQEQANREDEDGEIVVSLH